MEEWYIDEYGRDSELCCAARQNVDIEDSCWEYEECKNCPYYLKNVVDKTEKG